MPTFLDPPNPNCPGQYGGDILLTGSVSDIYGRAAADTGVIIGPIDPDMPGTFLSIWANVQTDAQGRFAVVQTLDHAQAYYIQARNASGEYSSIRGVCTPDPSRPPVQTDVINQQPTTMVGIPDGVAIAIMGVLVLGLLSR